MNREQIIEAIVRCEVDNLTQMALQDQDSLREYVKNVLGLEYSCTSLTTVPDKQLIEMYEQRFDKECPYCGSPNCLDGDPKCDEGQAGGFNPNFKAVIFEHQRYEVTLKAEDEEDARRQLDYIELETDERVTKDNDYYETEVASVEKT